MICKNCGQEVTKHTILQLCDDCYHARKKVYGKKYRDMNTSKPVSLQGRGVRTVEEMVCCRTDCNRKFMRQPGQHEKWSLCPNHKILANGYSGAVKWLGRRG